MQSLVIVFEKFRFTSFGEQDVLSYMDKFFSGNMSAKKSNFSLRLWKREHIFPKSLNGTLI